MVKVNLGYEWGRSMLLFSTPYLKEGIQLANYYQE